MCLAIPAKILEISGDIAKADFGGVQKEINISLVDAEIGEYVIVHAGFAIQILDEESANRSLEYFQEILNIDNDQDHRS